MHKRILTLLAVAGAAMAQTQVDLRTQSKSVDFGAAVSTRPFQTGTTLPSSCVVGNVFFNTSAPAGSNIYACTATNSWVLESGGSGGGGGGNMSTNIQNMMTRGQVITGSQDEVQLDITGNTTQTNPIFRVRTSAGANLIQANQDGSVNIGSGTGPEIMTEQAAPGGAPSSGTEWSWADASSGFTRGSNAAGLTFQMSKELTGLRYANGAGAADSPATAANVVGVFSGCSGTMYLGADGNCHTASGGGGSVTAGSQISVNGSTVAFNPLDFHTQRWGYDDFCANDFNTASGGTLLHSRMVYYSTAGGSPYSNNVPCGVVMQTSGNFQVGSSFNDFQLIPSTQAWSLEVVFKTSDATNASFGFCMANCVSFGGGSGNGIGVLALGGGSNIVMEACSSFSCASTSSGVAYAANTVYRATITTNGAGQACIQVNSGSSVCTSSNLASTLPGGLSFSSSSVSGTPTVTVLGWAYTIPGL